MWVSRKKKDAGKQKEERSHAELVDERVCVRGLLNPHSMVNMGTARTILWAPVPCGLHWRMPDT